MARLQGENVYLRPHEMCDAEIILAGSNEPEGGKLTGTHATFTIEQMIAYIERNGTADDRAGWVICDVNTDEVVGEVVINQIDEDNRSANIRIALFRPTEFGKGYGTEAMRLAIDYGFKTLKLHRISLGVFAFNPRAIHVYEQKLGFKREGVLRDSLYWEGEFHDEILMSFLEDEWQG